MRDLRTIFARLQCDMPITNEEADAMSRHLDAVIARQNRNAGIITAISMIGIVAMLALWLLNQSTN